MPGEIENHISSLGITLPKAAAPAANYVPYVQTGNQLFISGQIPMGPNGIEHQGKLGDDYSLENGQAAAKLCAINLLAQAKAALGDLDRIVRLVKIVGFVNSTPDYEDQDRDFDVGVLFDAHEDLAAGVKRALATAGLRTRLNEPYSGYRGEIYSASVHGEAHDVAYFEIELNQGVLEDPERRQRIADVFRQVVPAIFPHLPNR